MQFIPAIVGRNFRPAEARAVFDSLTSEDTIELEREPSNAYDQYAIKVLCRGEFIGYIERGCSMNLGPILDREEGAVAEGHIPKMQTLKVFSIADRKKPLLHIEITTGFELDTEVNVPSDEA